MTPPLDHLATRAAQFDWFFAHQLARYAAANSLTDDALAKLLRIPVRRLASLRLCSRIRVEDPDACDRDVRDLASRYRCDAKALAKVVLG